MRTIHDANYKREIRPISLHLFHCLYILLLPVCSELCKCFGKTTAFNNSDQSPKVTILNKSDQVSLHKGVIGGRGLGLFSKAKMTSFLDGG